MRLDKIKAIRDYWLAGHNMGQMQERFPDVPQGHINALTLETEQGKSLGLTLEQYRLALDQIPADEKDYRVIGPIVRSFVAQGFRHA